MTPKSKIIHFCAFIGSRSVDESMSTRGTQCDIHISFDDLSITVRSHQTRIRQSINGWKKPSA